MWKRFRFYGFGFLLGCLLVSVISKGKACKMPGTVKVEELSSQHLEYTMQATCHMQCLEMNQADVELFLKNGKINYDKSDIHAKPFGKFAVEGKTKTGQLVQIIVTDRDTISEITMLDLVENKTPCPCQ